MPAVLEILLLVAVVAGVIALRRAQPDPNPAIEAREAAQRAAGIAPVVRVERRIHPLPFVGRDRRVERAREAEAWRRSA